MKRLTLTLALLPALVLAAPQAGPPRGAGPGGPGGPDDPAHLDRMQRRMRLVRTLGLAEALDLDEAGAMKLRDTLARFDARRTPLQRQIRDAHRVLMDAARGDQAAAKQVDDALGKLREARTQLHALDTEMFGQLTQGFAPEKKARTALFLERFARHAFGPGGPGGGHGMMRGGFGRWRAGNDAEGGPGPRMGGPGFGPGMGPRGPGMPPGPPATAMGPGPGDPELDDLLVDD